MQQPRRRQLRIARLPQRNILVLACPVAQVPVEASVLLDGHPGTGPGAVIRRVVVTGPDLDVVRHAEEFAARLEEGVGAAAGEVAAGGADVRVEDGVAAEDVFWFVSWLVGCQTGHIGLCLGKDWNIVTSNPIPKMIRRMPRQMNSRSLQLPNVEHLVVLKQLPKHPLVLLNRHPIAGPKEILHLHYALPNPNRRRLAVLQMRQPVLQIRRSSEMVRVGVRLEDHLDLVAAVAHLLQQGVCAVRGDSLRGAVVVKHWVDDDCGGGCRV